MGDAEPGGKTLQARRNAASVADATTCHNDLARSRIKKAAFPRAADRLGAIDFPTKAVVDRQLMSDAPGILAKEKPTILGLAGIQHRADIALESRNIANEKCCQTRPASRCTLSTR